MSSSQTKSENQTKKELQNSWERERYFLPIGKAHMESILDASKAFISGAGAGVISKSSVAPCERIKILAQIERLNNRKRPIFQIVKDVYKNEGIIAFWKGNGANCTRIIPNKGILFMCNDMFIALFKRGKMELTLFDRLLSGSLSGAILITATYPLDLTTGRLAGGAKFNGIWDCLSNTFKQEGARGLYRGYFPSLLGIIPYTGCQFAAFEFFKSTIKRISSSNTNNTPVWISLTAGACAGTCAQTVSYPLDTIRRQLQIQGRVGTVHYSGMMDCFNKIYAKDGFKGFFRGMWVNVARAGPSQAIQFASYSFLKRHLVGTN